MDHAIVLVDLSILIHYRTTWIHIQRQALGLFGQEADDPPTNSGSISDPDTLIATDCSTDMTESWQHSYYGAPVHSRIDVSI
jgi:hypothetical protein